MSTPHRIDVDHPARPASASTSARALAAACPPFGKLVLHLPPELDDIGLGDGAVRLVALGRRLVSRASFLSPRKLEEPELEALRRFVEVQLLDGVGEGGLTVEGVHVALGLVGGPPGRVRQRRSLEQAPRRPRLLKAVEKGDARAALAAIEAGEEVDSHNAWRQTPLAVAAGRGGLELVELLLSWGADPDGRPADSGSTPLELAAMSGHAEVVRRLLDVGAEPDVVAGQKDPLVPDFSPLGWAASRGHRAIAQLLVDHGADPNHRNRRGQTPLHAARPGQDELLALLIEAGADPCLLDAEGRDPEAEALAQAAALADPRWGDPGAAAQHQSKASWLRLHQAQRPLSTAPGRS